MVRRSVLRCVVGSGLTLSVFTGGQRCKDCWPVDEVVQKKRVGWEGPSKTSVLCSEHFATSCFDPHIESTIKQGYAKCRQLSPDAYAAPTLWSNDGNKNEGKQLKKQEGARLRFFFRVSLDIVNGHKKHLHH